MKRPYSLPYIITFGERVRIARKRLSYTLQDVASASGLSKAFLSDVENGKKSISIHNAKRVSQFLSTSLDALMGDE